MKEILLSLLQEINEEFDPILSNVVDLSTYADKIASRAEIISIIENSVIKALIAVYCNDPEKRNAYITLFYVKEEYRKMGLGKRLLETLLQYLKGLQFQILKLEVFKTNKKAINFYLTNGFEEFEENETSKFLFIKVNNET